MRSGAKRTKQEIHRPEAEGLITLYQMRLLKEHNCQSTWELYALHGIGHCCGGVYALDDLQLREAYRRYIDDIDRLSGDELVKAIIDFELSQLPPGQMITCRAMTIASRLCDGLRRYTNQELSWLFPEVLGDYTVVD